MAYYRRRFRRYSRRRGGRRGFGISTSFLLGCAAAFVVPDNGQITNIATMAAVAPIRLGKIKGIAQGYVAGEILSRYSGLGNLITGKTGTGTVV